MLDGDDVHMCCNNFYCSSNTHACSFYVESKRNYELNFVISSMYGLRSYIDELGDYNLLKVIIISK